MTFLELRTRIITGRDCQFDIFSSFRRAVTRKTENKNAVSISDKTRRHLKPQPTEQVAELSEVAITKGHMNQWRKDFCSYNLRSKNPAKYNFPK